MGIPLPDELSIGARMRYAILSYFTMLQHYYFTLCDQINKNVWLYAEKKIFKIVHSTYMPIRNISLIYFRVLCRQYASGI